MERTAPIVLGVVGSPRRGGNTELLVEEVLRGAQDAGAQTDRIFLSELDIHPCCACERCVRTGECSRMDDMRTVGDTMRAASVWVLGTPVYLFSPTAQFKAFLDRWIGVPENVFAGKRAILVVPFAAASPEIGEPTLEILRRILRFRSIEHLDSIVASGLLDLGAVAARPEYLAAAFEAGRRAVSTPRGAPTNESSKE